MFLPGESELESMATHLKNKGMTDGRYDSRIRMDVFSDLEILLTKVSSSSNDNNKINFDH